MSRLTDTEQRDVVERLASADAVDIIEDPRKFGLPTFEEFSRNPEKWRRPPDEILRSADKGSSILRKLKEHRYYFEKIPCKSLEHVETVAKNEGVDTTTMQLKVGLESIGAGQFRAHCMFHRPGWIDPGEAKPCA